MHNKYVINNTVFLASIDTRTNTVSVGSCRPYDDQEYHWARRSKQTGEWNIYRNGKHVLDHAKELSEKDIAEILFNLDRPIKSRMCHN